MCMWWRCLFCDRRKPCDIDQLPRNHHEEDDEDELTEEQIRARTKCREAYDRCCWKRRRCTVLFFTFCWRVNPCNCLGGNTSRLCNEKKQPSPRQGLILVSTTKMLFFLGLSVFYGWKVWDFHGKVLLEEKLKKDVPEGQEWMGVWQDSHLDHSHEVRIVNNERAMLSSAVSILLFFFQIGIYLILLISAACHSLCAGCIFLIICLFPTPLIVYQPIYYLILQSTYVIHPANGTRSVHVLDGSIIYNDHLYFVWGITLLLIPYEIWMVLWHLRNVKIDQLKRLRVIPSDQTNDILWDPTDPDRVRITIFEAYHKESVPTEAESSYQIAQQIMFGKQKLEGDERISSQSSNGHEF